MVWVEVKTRDLLSNRLEWRKVNVTKQNYYEISIFKKEVYFLVRMQNSFTQCEVLLREYEFEGICRKMRHFIQADIKHPSFWENNCGVEYVITVEYNESSLGNFTIKDRNGNSITLDYDSVCSIISLYDAGFFDFYRIY